MNGDPGSLGALINTSTLKGRPTSLATSTFSFTSIPTLEGRSVQTTAFENSSPFLLNYDRPWPFHVCVSNHGHIQL